ncbi:tail assembly protein [Pseudomonas sp. PONIH3]|jgi:predicted phage tail protein|uniref:tail assembly protein n=1 Tax=Pseudomonas sp. PONIH3 TaxID=1636610 RepID=UPI000CDCCAD9|nr:tail assembly protein [Pseudomonas sp. PONIH3]AUY35048.1 tail assembly protein [Pseudomonas sp. PONIH3]
MASIAHDAPSTTTVYLSGPLIRKFFRKKDYLLDGKNTWEVFRALKATVAGFDQEIRRLEALGMRFAIFRNRKNVGADEFSRGGVNEVRIVPVIEGSKRAGLLQTIIGVALVIAAPFTGGSTMAAGIAIAAGGVLQMLSPQARGLSQSAAPENRPSYAFGSASNTTASGNPVPICIGERRWGGAIISASVYAEDKA